MVETVRLGFIMPVPPDKTGLAQDTEWMRHLSNFDRVKPIFLTPTSNSNPYLPFKSVYARSDILFPLRIAKAVKKERLEVLHFEYILGLYGGKDRSFFNYLKSVYVYFTTSIVLKLMRKKLILDNHKILNNEQIGNLKINSMLKRMVSVGNRIMNILTCLLADRVVVHNFAGKLELQKYTHHKDTVEYMPLPAVKSKIVKRSDHPFTFLYFGFIKPNKGIIELIDAFKLVSKEIKDVKLIISGYIDSSDSSIKNLEYFNFVKKSLEEVGREINIEHNLRYLEDDEIISILEVGDVIVMPYLDYNLEGSGIISKVIFAGLPFICTTTPRFQEIIQSGAALGVSPGDASELAERMKLIFKDNNIYSETASNVKRLFEKFDSKNLVEKYMIMYNEMFK